MPHRFPTLFFSFLNHGPPTPPPFETHRPRHFLPAAVGTAGCFRLVVLRPPRWFGPQSFTTVAMLPIGCMVIILLPQFSFSPAPASLAALAGGMGDFGSFASNFRTVPLFFSNLPPLAPQGGRPPQESCPFFPMLGVAAALPPFFPA